MSKPQPDQPLVSVIVPSYNHAPYIARCIESIVHQSYRHFELIVIDDGSTDDTKTVLAQLQQQYNFTLVFQQNRGVSAVLNRGITEFATGTYLTFCASDDYWAPDKLALQVQFMEQNRFYPMCYGKTWYIDEESKPLHEFMFHNDTLRGGWIFEDILLFRIHPPVNYLFRTEVFSEIGLYDETKVAEDYDMNLRIASKYAIGFIDQCLGYYRQSTTPYKLARFEKVSDSHLSSMLPYANHPLYTKAKQMVLLRKFDLFSGYTSQKRKAFRNMLLALPLWYEKRFRIAFVKLLVFWK
jgi:glycosyltransferase involved in cell wall biosynthesis